MINPIELEFSKKLIKGKIAEVVFEQMIRDEKRYTVIPFGYEHTMPTLAQYRIKFSQVQKIIENISEAPDFALISENKDELYLVEVKYQNELDFEKIKGYAEKLNKRWDYPWIFVATPQGFYCGMADWIISSNKINQLPESWVTQERQVEYLKLLNEFEKL